MMSDHTRRTCVCVQESGEVSPHPTGENELIARGRRVCESTDTPQPPHHHHTPLLIVIKVVVLLSPTRQEYHGFDHSEVSL